MMKKIMQVPDAAMRMYFELLTDLPLDEVNGLLSGHPKDAKIALAKSVIAEYHTVEAAAEAADRWQREISDKEKPQEVATVRISRQSIPDADLVAGAGGGEFLAVKAVRLLVLSGLCKTTSDARRSIEQGGAYYGPEKIPLDSVNQPVEVAAGLLLWVGKKRVVQVEIVERDV